MTALDMISVVGWAVKLNTNKTTQVFLEKKKKNK